MKKLYCLLIVAIAGALLSGCYDNGSDAAPPAGFAAQPGDGRVILTWIPDPGVEYWVFTATDPSLTAFNWSNLANAHAYTNAGMPFYMCGLLTSTVGSTNWTPYYFATNGRSSNGPGGPSSPTKIATPYNASTNWQAGSSPLSTANLYGVGYLSTTTCSNSPTSADGIFAAVGAGGAIFTGNATIITGSNNIVWLPANPPAGFSSDLYAVTGNAANLNYLITPGLLWIAVGAGGASIYSYDGINWYPGGPANQGTNSLRAITHSGSYFIAVGDSGTILAASGITVNGIPWVQQTSGTPNNLLGVTHGNFYTAVGENGTILTSSGTGIWTQQPVGYPPLTSETLRQVATYGSMTVAVGDNGTIVTSVNNGGQWTLQPALPGMPNLVSVVAESQVAAPGTAIDNVLGVVPYAQFVAMDSNGNAYTSVNGAEWSGPYTTGITSPNAMVSSGFGYVAAGNAGATAYAF
ncbi:MAG: hypothetical protein WBQ69_00120 [Gallionella sp.]